MIPNNRIILLKRIWTWKGEPYEKFSLGVCYGPKVHLFDTVSYTVKSNLSDLFITLNNHRISDGSFVPSSHILREEFLINEWEIIKKYKNLDEMYCDYPEYLI
jgi:hypothetical protein